MTAPHATTQAKPAESFDAFCRVVAGKQRDAIVQALPRQRDDLIRLLLQGLEGSHTQRTQRFEALVRVALQALQDDRIGLLITCAPPWNKVAIVPPDTVALVTLYFALVSVSPPYTDVLGDLHGRLLARFGGDGLGQHFTPPDLADLTVALALAHAARHPIAPRSGPVRLHDPACGAGALLLAQFRGDCPRPEQCAVVAQDIDPMCCAMTALQLTANAVCHHRPLHELTVLCGNTLSQGFSAPVFFHAQRRPSILEMLGWVDAGAPMPAPSAEEELA
ncbi:N-6 DNA methylase [Dyella psychrodurans]|uniref:DNA methylase adenine-specific domain-containing protein n=1 Tax=Dyella psychrodurans TaxID=1927960 RepID=A0A370XCA7_9GAMM|nr:N-6 DNA methylase [Dyella psychrodurans]RDS85917.1 hypothetical protein DWU99_01165 [Dyella psychrodurans]